MNTKVPVSERALTQRINRYLLAKNLSLKKRKSRYGWLGKFYLVAPYGVVRENVDIEVFARRAGILKSWEKIHSDPNMPSG